MGGCTDEPCTMDFPAAPRVNRSQSRRLQFRRPRGPTTARHDSFARGAVSPDHLRSQRVFLQRCAIITPPQWWMTRGRRDRHDGAANHKRNLYISRYRLQQARLLTAARGGTGSRISRTPTGSLHRQRPWWGRLPARRLGQRHPRGRRRQRRAVRRGGQRLAGRRGRRRQPSGADNTGNDRLYGEDGNDTPARQRLRQQLPQRRRRQRLPARLGRQRRPRRGRRQRLSARVYRQ